MTTGANARQPNWGTRVGIGLTILGGILLIAASMSSSSHQNSGTCNGVQPGCGIQFDLGGLGLFVAGLLFLAAGIVTWIVASVLRSRRRR